MFSNCRALIYEKRATKGMQRTPCEQVKLGFQVGKTNASLMHFLAKEFLVKMGKLFLRKPE